MKRPLHKRIREIAPWGILCFLILAAAIPGLLAPWAPGTLDRPYLKPGSGHLLGTGNIGQDLLTELLYSARISIGVALLASLAATAFGVLVGLTAGYLGKLWEGWLMRITDVFLLLPGLPLIILITAYLNSGLAGIAMVIGLTAWPGTARVVRTSVQQVRRHNFVRSAETMGAGRLYTMLWHILPNIYPLVLAKASLAAASAMAAEAGISFLGLGDPHYRSWGAMLHEAFTSGGLLNGAYWWYLPPVVCISGMVLCLTRVGERFMETMPAPLPFTRWGPGHRNETEQRAGSPALLEIRDLSIDFAGTDGSLFRAIDHLDLSIEEARRTAIIGQTGSGKSVLLLALMRLLPENAIISGEIRFRGRELMSLSEKALQRVRGREIGYVPQAAGNALNPLLTVGYQVAEAATAHGRASRIEAGERALEMLRESGIPDPEQGCRDYAHRFSGGMIQRVLVAMGLISGARLVLLDEPTKGLDDGNRNALLDILNKTTPRTLVVVTHDLEFAERLAQRVVVILHGRIVEIAPAESFFRAPLHPYSDALLKAQPRYGLRATAWREGNGSPTEGCSFAGYCPMAFSACRMSPLLMEVGSSRVRCWRYDSESGQPA